MIDDPSLLPGELRAPFNNPWGRLAFSVVSGSLQRMLALNRINQIYLQAAHATDGPFTRRILDVLQISYSLSDEERARVPVRGAVLIAANHPFGGLEALILADILQTIRPDVKFLANFMLERIPDIRDSCIYVDPFGRPDSKRRNLRPMKESIAWLKSDGLLGVFPAGEVSHMDARRGGVVDPPWNDAVSRLAARAGCPVVPVYFKGVNSILFQMAGLLHPRLRTALLPRELVNKRLKTIPVRIGHPIPWKKLEKLPDDAVRTTHIRVRCYRMGLRKESRDAPKRKVVSILVKAVKPERVPVVDATDSDRLSSEVEAIPLPDRLIHEGDTLVFHTLATRSPALVREVGRLREITFRDAGEGTGNAIDLDSFDDYYIHLIMWSTRNKEVMGAYRLGPTDLILPRLGKRGLYTQTLFKYRKSLLRQIDPALEMGRSFIRKEYQRSFSALLLLWKGIARYVAAHPRYKILFGPVSINNDYQSISRQLLITYLKSTNFERTLARGVTARNPVRRDLRAAWLVRRSGVVVESLDDVDELLSEIESDMKGIPVLLRQYLKLGGKLLAFNLDPNFSHVVDGLILVDLTQTDPKVLGRFMGKAEAAQFLNYHSTSPK